MLLRGPKSVPWCGGRGLLGDIFWGGLLFGGSILRFKGHPGSTGPPPEGDGQPLFSNRWLAGSRGPRKKKDSHPVFFLIAKSFTFLNPTNCIKRILANTAAEAPLWIEGQEDAKRCRHRT